MKTLYLQENIIGKIENLESMTELDTLNLSKNFVSKIENISHMKKLTTLIMSNNNLTSADSISHVACLPNLHALDIQSNKIDDDPEAILKILEACPELRVVYLKGNDVVKKISHYRKTLVSRCKNLRYLDDRPVFEDERRRCNVWGKVYAASGDVNAANEAEREEIANIRREKKEREERAFLQFEEMVMEGRRIKAQKDAEEVAKGGKVPLDSSVLSTDFKSFGVDGAVVDEKKMENDIGVGSHIVRVDRVKDEEGVNPFSGEQIVDAKESKIVSDAREARWGEGQRVLSRNVPKDKLPPPPPASTNEDIWNADEILSDEAKKEKEIEAYYTKMAGDKANFEKDGEGNEGDAAVSLDAGLAAELALLQQKTEQLNMKAIKEAEERAALEAVPPPPPPPTTLKAGSSLKDRIGENSSVGIGGSWPKKMNKVKGAPSNSNFDALD